MPLESVALGGGSLLGKARAALIGWAIAEV